MIRQPANENDIKILDQLDSWMTKKPEGFRVSDFEIDMAGKSTTKFSDQKNERVSKLFEFNHMVDYPPETSPGYGVSSM